MLVYCFVCSTINKYINSLVCVYILSCLLSLMCEFSSYVYLNFVEKRKYVEEKNVVYIILLVYM